LAFLARNAIPAAAILMPAGFFLSAGGAGREQEARKARHLKLATVQKMAGHASVSTTGRYDRRDYSAQRTAARSCKCLTSHPTADRTI
jgi:hypothetical protein